VASLQNEKQASRLKGWRQAQNSIKPGDKELIGEYYKLG
jgi:hypothetical protein